MKNSSDISKMKDLCDSHPEEAEKPKKFNKRPRGAFSCIKDDLRGKTGKIKET